MPNKRYILTTIAKVLKLGFEDNQLYQFDVDTASISSDGKMIIKKMEGYIRHTQFCHRKKHYCQHKQVQFRLDFLQRDLGLSMQ